MKMPQPTLGVPASRSLNLPFRHSNTTHHKTTSTTNNHKLTSDASSDLSFDFHSSPRRTSSDRRPVTKSAMDIFSNKDKRKSLGLQSGRSSSPAASSAAGAKSSPRNSPKVGPAKPAKLVVDMESPPLVFYGSTSTSSGALLSGQLLLTVTDPDITLQSFTMDLVVRTATRKPVAKDCLDCLARTKVLFTWKFLTEANRFKKGTHTFPFSYLLPGHLPATCRGDLGSIDYMLDAHATTTLADKITVSRNLTVQRALMPGMDKNSIRIFPPTNLTATVALPSIIHPIGTFPLQMRLTGIVDTSSTTAAGVMGVQRRWRIRKMQWRIDESSRIVSAACAKHAARIGGEGKGILHEDVRSIGGDEIKGGWKTDFDTNGGQIECEFPFACNPSIKPPPLCDMDSPHGLTVSHSLVLEIVVAEEQTTPLLHNHNHKGGSKTGAVPTGAARVLRMQFKLLLTERAGMGISWDEEQPPMYEDVPRSPPGYTKIEDWEGGELPEVTEDVVVSGGVGVDVDVDVGEGSSRR